VKIQLFHRGEAIEVEVDGSGASRGARIGERRVAIEPIMLDPSAGTLRIDGQPVRFLHERSGGSVRIAIGGECFDFELSDAGRSRRAVSSHGNPETRAPMPGKVLQVTARVDDEVKPGDPLLILEAMKMENVLSAEIAGRVREVHIKPGDMVEPGKLLVLVEPKD
jgi:acetyl/propionyl-CoA carboxylase alpha subunit